MSRAIELRALPRERAGLRRCNLVFFPRIAEQAAAPDGRLRRPRVIGKPFGDLSCYSGPKEIDLGANL
jgi:hypothetical protein